jgi:hypothetical protein
MSEKSHTPVDAAHDTNPDPISGTAGAHPLGTGIGAAGGAAAGASIGAVAGPMGAALGTLVGAVAGGLAGKGAAEAIHPTDPTITAQSANPVVEDDYWRRNYASRSYVTPGATYETYRMAYQFGWEGYRRYHGRAFADVESSLRRDWERLDREMSWEVARHATRDAWHRLDEQHRLVAGRERR